MRLHVCDTFKPLIIRLPTLAEHETVTWRGCVSAACQEQAHAHEPRPDLGIEVGDDYHNLQVGSRDEARLLQEVRHWEDLPVQTVHLP